MCEGLRVTEGINCLRGTAKAGDDDDDDAGWMATVMCGKRDSGGWRSECGRRCSAAQHKHIPYSNS